MDPGLVACIKAATNVSVADYQLARERKMAYVAAIHRWFEDWDFLLTPVGFRRRLPGREADARPLAAA